MLIEEVGNPRSVMKSRRQFEWSIEPSEIEALCHVHTYTKRSANERIIRDSLEFGAHRFPGNIQGTGGVVGILTRDTSLTFFILAYVNSTLDENNWELIPDKWLTRFRETQGKRIPSPLDTGNSGISRFPNGLFYNMFNNLRFVYIDKAIKQRGDK